jgi:excisionase family DNA binding protein
MASQLKYQELCEGGLDRIRDAEDFTRLSRSKLYALMKAGELPYVRIGRCRRIPHRALIELAARHAGSSV